MKKRVLFLLLTVATFNVQAEVIHQSINVNSPEFQADLTDKDTLLVDYTFQIGRPHYPSYYELQCISNPDNSASMQYTLSGYPLTHILPVAYSELIYGNKHGYSLETYGQFKIVSMQSKSHVQCKFVYKDRSSE